MQQTNDLEFLGLAGGQPEDTPTGPPQTDRARLGKLRAHLRGLKATALGLDFTDKGRANICRRFNVSPAELAGAVARLSEPPRPGRPTPELLRTIGAAVGRPAAIGGEGLC